MQDAASRLRNLFEQLSGEPLPVRLRAWDGSGSAVMIRTLTTTCPFRSAYRLPSPSSSTLLRP